MNTIHGKLLIIIGAMHSTFGLTPWAFGETFLAFGKSRFFNINPGLSDFPLLGGAIDGSQFAAFWFVYFGFMLIPLGLLVQCVQRLTGHTPKGFAIAYLIVVLIGAYMIPFSGMTIIMLPHALFMLRDAKNLSKRE